MIGVLGMSNTKADLIKHHKYQDEYNCYLRELEEKGNRNAFAVQHANEIYDMLKNTGVIHNKHGRGNLVWFEGNKFELDFGDKRIKFGLSAVLDCKAIVLPEIVSKFIDKHCLTEKECLENKDKCEKIIEYFKGKGFYKFEKVDENDLNKSVIVFRTERGFDIDGVHENGTLFNDEGFDKDNKPAVIFTGDNEGNCLRCEGKVYYVSDYIQKKYWTGYTFKGIENPELSLELSKDVWFYKGDNDFFLGIIGDYEKEYKRYFDEFTSIIEKAIKILIKQIDIRGDVVLVPVPRSSEAKKPVIRNSLNCIPNRLAGNGTSNVNIAVGPVLKRFFEINASHANNRNRADFSDHLNSIKCVKELDPTKTYIIVDDVKTRGDTINACKYILSEAGAKHIEMLTVLNTVFWGH